MTDAVGSGMGVAIVTTLPAHDHTPERAPLPFAEFVAMVASLMALGAFGVDMMLPALPAIGRTLGIAAGNAQQYVITAYLIGLGLGQLLHGPLSDRFGRRRVMMTALATYLVTSLIAAASGSFALLLVMRFASAVAAAATRVVTVAIVRDRFAGRAMARVMSLASMVFMVAPVMAPTIGQFVLLFGNWRLIFCVIAALTAAVLAWFGTRLPETLHAEDRHPISVERIWGGWRTTLGDRYSLGYTLGMTMMQGALFAYISSLPQVLTSALGAGRLLSVVFATTAGTMAAANLLNSRLVMRLGSRLLSHSAVVVLIVLAVIALALGASGRESLPVFMLFQALMMGCFGLANSNFSAMAMEKMGHIAGTASSLQGFISVTGGALIGAAFGQAFDGTTRPLHLAFLLCGLAALAIAAVTERGRLFRPA